MSWIDHVQPFNFRPVIESHIVRLLLFKGKAFSRREKVSIGIHDTLVTLAEEHCHDVNLGWLIADLNLTCIKETFIDSKRIVEIRRRQELELPALDDIENFYCNRPKNAVPENLITIVVRYETDVDLIESYLSSVFTSPALD